MATVRVGHGIAEAVGTKIIGHRDEAEQAVGADAGRAVRGRAGQAVDDGGAIGIGGDGQGAVVGGVFTGRDERVGGHRRAVVDRVDADGHIDACGDRRHGEVVGEAVAAEVVGGRCEAELAGGADRGRAVPGGRGQRVAGGAAQTGGRIGQQLQQRRVFIGDHTFAHGQRVAVAAALAVIDDIAENIVAKGRVVRLIGEGTAGTDRGRTPARVGAQAVGDGVAIDIAGHGQLRAEQAAVGHDEAGIGGLRRAIVDGTHVDIDDVLVGAGTAGKLHGEAIAAPVVGGGRVAQAAGRAHTGHAMRRIAHQAVADLAARHVAGVGQGGVEHGVFVDAEAAVGRQRRGRQHDGLVSEGQALDAHQGVEARDAVARLDVQRAVGVGDLIRAARAGEAGGIEARAAIDGIVAQAAGEGVVQVIAQQHVVVGRADGGLDQCRGGEGQVVHAGQADGGQTDAGQATGLQVQAHAGGVGRGIQRVDAAIVGERGLRVGLHAAQRVAGVAGIDAAAAVQITQRQHVQRAPGAAEQAIGRGQAGHH